MMEKADLLFELGTEELPPKALKSLAYAFSQDMRGRLQKAELHFDDVVAYATPRRLALWVKGLDGKQQDKVVEKRGPALKAAFDADGRPTKAAMGFAGSCGVDASDLETLETDKGAWVVARVEQPGQSTETLVPGMIESALSALPIPKRMRWGAHSFQFIRPVHWLVLLFDGKTVKGEMFGLSFGNRSRGHRFHHPHTVTLNEPPEYQDRLYHANVMVDFAQRRQAIEDQVTRLAESVHGQAQKDEALLDEVTGLVEWPKALLGQFDKKFLDVPAEALVAAMKGHQRYFPVLNSDGGLLPYFITVSNIESLNPEAVKEGNERVIRPRLEDAEFFWRSDQNQPLAQRLEALKDVVFQKQLGTLYDKTQRLVQLAGTVATDIATDKTKAERAATLCKCDLLTDMVGEFPELQGVMGRYYAVHDGEDDGVAQAIDEHYWPRGAGDRLPASAVGQCVALADRLDTMVGLFAAGKAPTGDKDPFGLRRAALGVLRLLIEQKLDLDLQRLLAAAAGTLDGTIKAQKAVEPVFDFMMDRLRVYYQDRNISADVIEAVMATRPTNMTDFDLRIQGVKVFRDMPESETLAAANKRIRNILRKAEDSPASNVDPAMLQEGSEKALAQALDEARSAVQPLLGRRQYTDAMKHLAGLKSTVDAFFDNVMVMVDDTDLRRNRLTLLNELSELFLQIADLSKLQ